MKVAVSETIRAKRHDVFAVFTDLEGAVERIEGIKKIEFLGELKSGLGVRWRETRVMFGKEATEEMEITDFKEPDAYVVEAESHGTHYTSVFTFKDTSDGATEVTWTFEGKPLSLFAKVMAPLAMLMSRPLRKMLKKDMIDLKRSIER